MNWCVARSMLMTSVLIELFKGHTFCPEYRHEIFFSGINQAIINHVPFNKTAVKQLCVTLELDSQTHLLSQSHLMAISKGFAIVYLQGSLQVHEQEGTVCSSMSQSLCKDFSILYVKISDNVAEVVPTHQCHWLTQQMNHIQSSKPSINEELSSYLLSSPIEEMVANFLCIIFRNEVSIANYCQFSFHWLR